jgi:hypothetical protein
MLDAPEFKEFQKIFRLNRETMVTEKIDGTNGVIHISEDGQVFAGSRTRWVTPESDNHGFARWVKEHEEELRTGLGFGTHYGEWWGSSIQRGYGLKEKRFSLFNVSRWADDNVRPKCCHSVPILGIVRSLSSYDEVSSILLKLREGGSVAAPGFSKPEGIVLFHVPSENLYKVTLEKDSEPKGLSK